MASENPWMDMHMGYAHGCAERALTALEYMGAPEPMPCPCGECPGTLYFRATVGSMQCTTCRVLAFSDGDARTECRTCGV